MGARKRKNKSLNRREAQSSVGKEKNKNGNNHKQLRGETHVSVAPRIDFLKNIH